MERSMICAGHEELRDIATETRADVKHCNEMLQAAIHRMEECDKRVRHLEINGAAISQQNAKDLKEIKDRVDTIESKFDIIKGAEKQATKISAVVAILISGAFAIVAALFGGV